MRFRKRLKRAWQAAHTKRVYLATNDANRVIEERNAAIASANQALDQYNTFFKIDTKK